MKVKPLDEHRREDLSKSRSDLGSSIIKEARWHEIHNFKSLWMGRR
jgi:hypothetical protein